MDVDDIALLQTGKSSFLQRGEEAHNDDAQDQHVHKLSVSFSSKVFGEVLVRS